MKRCHDDGDILGVKNTKADNGTSEEDQSPVEDDRVVVPEKNHGINVGTLSERDLRRYSSWKRTVFSDEDVVDMIYPHSTKEFNDIHVSIVSACVKMYIGDLIEGAIINKDTPIGIDSLDIEESFARICRGRRILPDCFSSIYRKRRRFNMPRTRKDFWAD